MVARPRGGTSGEMDIVDGRLREQLKVLSKANELWAFRRRVMVAGKRARK